MTLNPATRATLSRDCVALRIPTGESTTLAAGSEVEVTQTLGGFATVATEAGLFRIDGTDLDALGMERPAPAAPLPEIFSEDLIWDQLRTCYDPEIPVNIVDLGLIYDLRTFSKPDGRREVAIQMTLTAPGCGMGPAIAEDVRRKLVALPAVDSAEVRLVWDPQWQPSMITEAGRATLGLE